MNCKIGSMSFSTRIEETTKEDKCDFALAPSVTFTASQCSLDKQLSSKRLFYLLDGGDVSLYKQIVYLLTFFKLLLINFVIYYEFELWIIN